MIVVTCMGRLDQLRRTLPAMERHDEIVLVDWSCPEKCGEWARSTNLGVHVSSRVGETTFHKSAALNQGARHAIELGASYLLFLDADTLIKKHNRFGSWYATAKRDRSSFHICTRGSWHLLGVLGCTTEHFEASGGFDERMRGWGKEDIDMRLRLAIKLGLPWKRAPHRTMEAIDHGDDDRVRFYEEKQKDVSNARNWEISNSSMMQWCGRRMEDLPPVYHELFCGQLRRVIKTNSNAEEL